MVTRTFKGSRYIIVSWLFVLYVIVGIVVAINNSYASHGLHSAKQFFGFWLADLIWPLIMLGVQFSVR